MLLKIKSAILTTALAAIPLFTLVYLVSQQPEIENNIKESYSIVQTKWNTFISATPTLFSELELEGDKFNKRKVRKYLEEAFQYDDILNLHTSSITLMETYPKHEMKIQKLTIRVANENRYSLRCHPDDRSIIYRKLTPKEMEKILAEEEEVEEIVKEMEELPTPTIAPSVEPTVELGIKAFPNPTAEKITITFKGNNTCLLYTSPSPRDATLSRMPSSA